MFYIQKKIKRLNTLNNNLLIFDEFRTKPQGFKVKLR